MSIIVIFEELNGHALRFQELYYSERKHIGHLDQQRRGGFLGQDVIPA